MDFYSDNDAGACAWTRELIKGGHIPQGVVDERSIADLRGEDLRGFRRVHLFAGIGGWGYALELAGWPADRSVWSGFCPCQDFSAAGKGEGHGGARNLWPEMLRLIRECRPATIFGEQVDAAIRFGWLDVLEIVRLRSVEKMGTRELGRMFGVDHSQVTRIVQGKTYRTYTSCA